MEEKDFVFRFELDVKDPAVDDMAAVREMVREQLNNLLDVVYVYFKGERVKVDGFAFINEPEKVYPIFKVSN